MEIVINNETKQVNYDSLQSLVTGILGEKTKGIAVAINDNIVPKTHWESTALKEKDNVLIIKATQGG
ncbi:MAG: thiamine biosynthesis protein ThiS [Bacteroidetes bacterium]|jgi:sulfur carrier protein|nr:thiamine biosynthesis protein ThiS [Bacteroidota bacterium]